MKMDERAGHAVAPEEVMAYLDGELNAEEAVAVAAHLRECGYCAVIAEELSGVSRELRAWTVETAPERLGREIRRAVGEKTPERGTGRRILVWGGAAAFAVIVVAGFVGWQFSSSNRMAHANLYSQPAMSATVPAVEGSETWPSPTKNATPRSTGGAEVELNSYNGNLAQLTQIAPGVAGTGAASATAGKADRYKGGVENLGTGPLMPMIARTASLTVLVKNFDIAHAKLEQILEERSGYAADVTILDADPPRGLEGGLRIPASELQTTLAEIRALGRVEKETQKGEEVTQQHADLVARLTNAREEETRLRALLAERTGKIEDVLQVEEEIARVRGEVEQMEAEQKGLEHRVDFASVELKLVEEYAAKLGSPEGTGTRLHNGFVDGIRNAGQSLLNLAVFLEEIGPVLVIWGLIVGVPVWLIWRRYRRARGVLR